MIKFSHKGDFKKTDDFFHKILRRHYMNVLNKYGQRGVEALSHATPVDTGKTAASWSYEIQESDNSIEIIWSNSNVNKGLNIAILLQYGHGTRNGGYVVGRDYINPALQPLFDELADKAWEEVVSK